MKIRFRMAILVMFVAMVRPVHAQYIGSHVMADGADNTNFFMGRTLVGSSNAPGTDKFYVNGDATIEGAVKVPKQGDVSMGPFTNGVSAAGLNASNLAVRGHWISSDGDNEGIFVTTDGYVGIGTNGAGSPLTVSGIIESKSGGFKFPDGTTQGTAVSFVNVIGTTSYVNTGFTLLAGDNITLTPTNNTYKINSSASGSNFVNTLGDHVYTNIGINLKAGSNITLRTNNGGTNYYIDHNVPMFWLSKSTNQSFSEAVWSKVAFSNTNAMVSMGVTCDLVNSRVTILQSGKYVMNFTLGISEAQDKSMAALYKNSNSLFQVSSVNASADTTPERRVDMSTPIMNLVSGDFFEVFYYEVAGATGGLLGGTNYTWWTGWRVE